MPAPVPPARRAALRRRLLAWWDAGHRKLPWRCARPDPYRVWLAEVMLQQTRVAAAIPHFERFVARWPTLEALAAARDEEVFAAFSGLGYYARCRNLLAAARETLHRHGGLPGSPAELRALPGFGPYTAGAVASIAFASPVPAVDGNVARVLARLFRVEGDPARPAVRDRLWALAGALVPQRRPGDWNQALMELGAIVELAEAVLLVRRPAGGLLAGLLGFPAVELQAEEDARGALRDHLRRAHGIAAAVEEELGSVERVLTHRLLEVRAYRCRLAHPPGTCEDRTWIAWPDLSRAGLPRAMEALAAILPGGSDREVS